MSEAPTRVADHVPSSAPADLASEAFEAFPDATAIVDGAGIIVAVNRTWRRISADHGGSESTNGIGVNYLEVCDRSAHHGCEDALRVGADLQAVLDGRTGLVELDYPCPADALERWFMLRMVPLIGPLPGAVLSHVDITRRKLAEDRLAHAASHDPLSGLANRVLLIQHLTKALTPHAGRRTTPDVGVLMIDLDGFKAVNDTLGHTTGDEVLRNVAQRLQQIIRPGDTIARFGGDEFVLVAPRISAAGLRSLAGRVRASLAQAHSLTNRAVVVTGTVGSYLAGAGEQAVDVLGCADLAMYAEKNRGRITL